MKKTMIMKNIYLPIVMVLIASTVFAQKTEEKEIKSLMKDLGYSWSETRSVKLMEGQSEYYWRSFFSGNEYAVLAFSEDDNVHDIDIYLYNEEGSLIYQSKASENFDIIEFSPDMAGQVKVVIKNYDSLMTDEEYKCKFMMFYK